MIRDGHCIRTIHAEINAICNLQVNVPSLHAYGTHSPCYNCYKYLVASGVKRFHFIHKYEDSLMHDVSRDYGWPIVLENCFETAKDLGIA